ncbi:HelD family protein [Gordonia sp. (in: high G+C Gram-positive bacteria)]|uniref:HelD family protein n=1 Tax=Gordonia sp. (in: high G+C Gram-positive bacteria) TaxID=84139 RepID=UPI0039E360DF
MSEDPVLTAERVHLDRSRAALAAMRARTADWTKAIAGDHVSTQYLRQQLYRRAESLADDPSVPLFFGRIDYAATLGAERDETCHIGRRHVEASIGDEPLVMDWRAPMALPFYRARPGDPMGVALRRRFGFQHGAITAYEDEQLAEAVTAATSALLEAEIERPRSGPMRDIVATIQPDQDVLVRTDLATSLAIQGAPGTGKTAVGLHRAAYLLYTYRAQLSRSGVLVLGPNDSFLGYIGDVLPALGEIDASQATIESLVGAATGLAVTGTDPAPLAVLKGDPRMAEVLRRAVWSHLGTPDGTLEVPYGHRLHRLRPAALADILSGIAGQGARYETGRAMLPQRIAHRVLLQMEADGETTDDRVQNAVARSRPVAALCRQLWPRVSAAGVVHAVLGDPDLLARAAVGILDADERALLQGARARSARARRWTLADVVLVDEVEDLLARQPSLGHVIIDEAQDLSPMMLRAAGRRATTGSVTLLGDLAQATTAWAVHDWADALAHVGHPEAPVTELVEGFRVPGDVIDYAARLLPRIAPGLTPPRSIRHARGQLDIAAVADPVAEVAATVTGLLSREGTLGVIVPSGWVSGVDAALAGTEHRVLGDAVDPDAFVRVEVVDAALAKGLEFDHVLLLEPARVVADEPDRGTGLRRLYVCLTRAVTSLTVRHAQPLPPELGRPPSLTRTE